MLNHWIFDLVVSLLRIGCSGSRPVWNLRKLYHSKEDWHFDRVKRHIVSACATVATVLDRPSGDPSQVEILRAEPTRAHERLGEIVVDATVEPTPPVADVEQRLRAQGAKLGADAVVVVYDRLQPVALYVSGPWRGQSIEGVSGRKLVGVAIKYRP